MKFNNIQNIRTLILEVIHTQLKYIDSIFQKIKFDELIKEYIYNLLTLLKNDSNYIKDLSFCLTILNQYDLDILLNFMEFFKTQDISIGLNHECIILILKHFTNMSNYNEEICEKFTQKGLQTIAEMVYLDNFDIQVLCFGLLINLTEKTSNKREQISKIKVNNEEFIQYLIKLFQKDIENNEIDKNIHKSYIGVLLGCLSKDNKENYKRIEK